MSSSNKILIGVVAAAAVVGLILLTRRTSAAAPSITAPTVTEVAGQNLYSGFLAANAPAPGGGSKSLGDKFGAVTGASTEALCQASTGGNNPLCGIAGQLSGKFSSVVGNTAEKALGAVYGGAKSVVSGAKSVFSKLF
jgi:hypothetical protein